MDPVEGWGIHLHEFRQAYDSGTNIVAAEVRLEFACKDFESGTLADTIGSDKTEHLTGSWCW